MITAWRAAIYSALFALAIALFHTVGSARADTAAGLSETPVLRIETGMHTAKIGRIAIHPGTNILASASYDKTLRLWSLGDGRLIRTLRVPIGAAWEGALYGVAISPDGTMIATAGWTGKGEGPNWSLYLFDIPSGEMIRRVADLPHRGLHLAFSPDGQYLAVTLKNGHGFRVYRAPDFTLAADRPVRHPDGLPRGDENDDADDPNCRASSLPYLDQDNPEGVAAPSSGWVEFDGQGRLVTVSLDGAIRLFNAEFNLLRAPVRRAANGRHRPASRPTANTWLWVIPNASGWMCCRRRIYRYNFVRAWMISITAICGAPLGRRTVNISMRAASSSATARTRCGAGIRADAARRKTSRRLPPRVSHSSRRAVKAAFISQLGTGARRQRRKSYQAVRMAHPRRRVPRNGKRVQAFG